MDVGENTTRCDGNTSEELVQLFIVLDCQRNVTRNDTALLVVASGVSSKLQDFSCEVLEHSGEVDWRTSSHASGVLALTQVTSDTTNRELKASLRRRGGGLLVATATLSFSCTRVSESKNGRY